MDKTVHYHYHFFKTLSDSVKRINLRERVSESIVKDEINSRPTSQLISREITRAVDDIASDEFTLHFNDSKTTGHRAVKLWLTMLRLVRK